MDVNLPQKNGTSINMLLGMTWTQCCVSLKFADYPFNFDQLCNRNPAFEHLWDSNILHAVAETPFEPDQIKWFGTVSDSLRRFFGFCFPPPNFVWSQVFAHWHKTGKPKLGSHEAFGTFRRQSGDLWDVNDATVRNIIHSACKLLCTNRSRYKLFIQEGADQSEKQLSEDLYSISNF